MDEDSDLEKDLDNSLLDLHHGLDSSTEENRIEDGVAEQDVYDYGSGTQPADLPAQHVSMLEEMVQEMRQGLHAAVEELAKLQVREDVERDRHIQQQQQRQLDSLTESVNELKSQMSSMTKCLETIQRDNSRLREDYTELHKHMKDNKGVTHQSNHSFEWEEKLQENPFEPQNEDDEATYRHAASKANDEVTAVACKSLSLTQALGEKCLHLNLSLSSDEGDEPEIRRLSHFTPSNTDTNHNDDGNRRHSLPASTTPRGTSIANAGQRRKAVKELTDSECDYCSQLWTLIETYCASLQNAGFLSADQLEVLFPPYLEKLYEQHCFIYSNLQDKLVHWSYLTAVSDLLSCITDTHNPYSLLSLYREYSENLPDAVSCLTSGLAHSTELKAHLKTIQQSSYQNEDLMSLIKAPAQHLPKYLLQLQQICKYTPSTHPDYLLLRTSLSRLRLFVEQMNIGINNAMQTNTQDFRLGSSNDSSQVLSARDSGNISNDDELVSARTLFKSEQCLLSEDHPNDPHHMNVPDNHVTYYGRHARGFPKSKSSNLSTHSHPDLSRINSAPFSLPPTGLGHGWRNGVEGRQPVKSKMKRIPVQQHSPFIHHQDPNHHLSRSRPSSAIDFTSGYNNLYPVHHYPGTDYPRPQSALGPLDSHHRPTIISRKHMRRSQPPLSHSGYWADVDSQHPKHPQQQQQQQLMSFSPHELLPSRPSPLPPPYNSHEDDEEDDTRASDSYSFATSSSHQQSSGRGSHNGHDLDLDFQPLASDPSPFRPNGSNKQFSEDDVAVRLAQELLSDDDNDHKEFNNGDVHDGINNQKIIQAAENNSYIQQRESVKTKTDEFEKKIRLSKHQLSNSNIHKSRDKTVNKLSKSTDSEGFENRANDEDSVISNKLMLNSSPHNDVNEIEREQESRVLKQNGDHGEESFKKDQPNENVDDKRLKNQHFLMSLSHSPRSKKSSESKNLYTKISNHESPQMLQSKLPVSTATGDKQSDKQFLSDKTVLPHKSQPKVVRRSAPSLISQTRPNLHHQDHGQARVSSSPVPSINSGSLQTDLDNSITSAAPIRNGMHSPHSSTLPLEASSSDRKSTNIDHTGYGDDSKNLMTRSLDLSEMFNSEDRKETMHDRRRKPKNGGTDSLPKASDDPVNARKKMHLKSSIKNLFTKKRGKVILADVEKEVILEMASAVVSGSNSPLFAARGIKSTLASSSAQGNMTNESSVVASNNKQVGNKSKTFKESQKQDEIRQKVDRVPPSFDIKCKMDKASSTSSPLKVWRPINCTQPFNNPATNPFPMFSLSADTVAQSPCKYQEKLLKERLNAKGNPQLEQKPLIHPKFLVSTPNVSKENENEILQSVGATTNSVVTPNTTTSSKRACTYPDTQPIVSMQTNSQFENVKQPEDSLSKNFSKYSESDKRHLKTKMKAYAHIKKHILYYESQEAGNKGNDELMKKSQEKSKTKSIKHKAECPKCQSKSLDALQDQTLGKSFHIQAYKAYKNQNNIPVVDKQETTNFHPKAQTFQYQSKSTSEAVSNQSSMQFLKPCEEAIAFYETSRNPKMTSSYPMALPEKKLKKKYYPIKESCKVPSNNCLSLEGSTKSSTSSHTFLDTKESDERNLRESILSLSSGVFYDSTRCLPNGAPIAINNIPTNDLSHPTSTALSCNGFNVPKPYSFNVPASNSTNGHNKRFSYDSALSVDNILKISKDELFESGKSRTINKDSKVKSDLKKMTIKPNDSKECVLSNVANPMNCKQQDILETTTQKQMGATIQGINATGHTKNFDLKEKDYFDYKYRLCYVDCNKFDTDLNFCSSCSAEDNNMVENGVVSEDKSFHPSRKNDNLPKSKVSIDTVKSPKCKVEEDKRLQIETKSSIELENWLSRISSSPLHIKNSGLPEKEPNKKCVHSNNLAPCGKCSFTQNVSVSTRGPTPSSGNSVVLNGWKEYCLQSQSKHDNCSLHAHVSRQTAPMNNRYNRNSSTLETFSPSMSQPIFSVLPFEAYRVDTQPPMKSDSHSFESQNKSQANSPFTKSQDDAIARRALKQRVKAKDASRLSTCSISSANEIHFVKPHNLSDAQCSVDSGSNSKQIKDILLPNKNGDSGTLQVRYIPKQCGLSRQNKVQTTAHAQIKKDSKCVNGNVNNLGASSLEGSTANPPINTGQYNTNSFPSQSQRFGSSLSQNTQSNHDQNGLSASAVSGPDLLQVSVIQPGSANKSESSTPPKKPSFFTRFTQSPLSIFYKEAKNSGSK